MSTDTQNSAPVSVGPVVTLNGAQLLQALDFIAPDRDTDPQQLECELTISFADGPAGGGYYCYCTDYPDEGAIMLDAETADDLISSDTDTDTELTQQTLDDVKAGIPARDAEIEALRKELETLQAEVLSMVQMLETNEWADHCGESELGQRLEWAITALQNRQQNIPDITPGTAQQDADRVDAGQSYNDGFSDGVILALQLMTIHGDYGGTQYCELLSAAGPNQIVERAISEGMWEMSGLSQTPTAVERRAVIDAARKENSNA